MDSLLCKQRGGALLTIQNYVFVYIKIYTKNLK